MGQTWQIISLFDLWEHKYTFWKSSPLKENDVKNYVICAVDKGTLNVLYMHVLGNTYTCVGLHCTINIHVGLHGVLYVCEICMYHSVPRSSYKIRKQRSNTVHSILIDLELRTPRCVKEISSIIFKNNVYHSWVVTVN